MTGLSSAAQAVWRAHEQVLGGECVLTKTDMEALAAALRAAADQVVPETNGMFISPVELQQEKTRDQLLAIADELEGK
jgi:hypothetical protein